MGHVFNKHVEALNTSEPFHPPSLLCSRPTGAEMCGGAGEGQVFFVFFSRTPSEHRTKNMNKHELKNRVKNSVKLGNLGFKLEVFHPFRWSRRLSRGVGTPFSVLERPTTHPTIWQQKRHVVRHQKNRPHDIYKKQHEVLSNISHQSTRNPTSHP